jgi:hypothetical protein
MEKPYSTAYNPHGQEADERLIIKEYITEQHIFDSYADLNLFVLGIETQKFIIVNHNLDADRIIKNDFYNQKNPIIKTIIHK